MKNWLIKRWFKIAKYIDKDGDGKITLKIEFDIKTGKVTNAEVY